MGVGFLAEVDANGDDLSDDPMFSLFLCFSLFNLRIGRHNTLKRPPCQGFHQFA